MLFVKGLGLLLLINLTMALYDSDKYVVKLTSANFNSEVTESNNLTVVNYYTTWCSHSVDLADEYKKAAKNLSGEIKVGAVDCDENAKLCRRVRGFPTILMFQGKVYEEYEGKRKAKVIAETARIFSMYGISPSDWAPANSKHDLM